MSALPLVSAAAITLLAFVFAQAAWHKLSDFIAFTGYLADYRLLPEVLVKPVAATLAAAEVFVVIGLLLPAWRAPAASVAITLLALYAASMAINLVRGRNSISCGCGGAVQPISSALLVRNALLGLAAAITIFYPVSALGFGAASASFAVGFLAWVLLGTAEQIVANGLVARRLRQF